MGTIVFLVFLKFLAWLASSIVAGSAGATWLDVTGELEVFAIRSNDGTASAGGIALNPTVYFKMALRLVFWQELIFQQIPPFGPLLGGGLTIMSGWVVLGEFKNDATNAVGRLLGSLRGG